MKDAEGTEGLRRTSCRDLFNDIAMPGGIANKSFVREWDGFCAAMDSNDFSKLPRHSAIPLMLVSK